MTSRDFFIKKAKNANNITDYLREELKFAGFGSAEIKKTPLGTRITIYAVRPGLVIGSGGSNIKAMTETIEKRFKVENPHIEVEQVDDVFLNPHIVAWRIAKALEKGTNFKRIAAIMIQRIIQSGARGVEIRLSGKLPSKRAKIWKFTAGNPKKCGQDVIDHARVGYEIALKKLGVIGIRVMIMPPGVRFSDEIREIVIEEKVTPSKKKDGKIEDAAENTKSVEKIDVVDKKNLEKVVKTEVPEALPKKSDSASTNKTVEERKTEDEVVTVKETTESLKEVKIPKDEKSAKVEESKVKETAKE